MKEKKEQKIKGVEPSNLKKIFLEEYAEVPIISSVCKKLGISRTTFYNWLQSDKEFAEKVEELNKKRLSILEDAMYSHALKGNPTLLIFLACNWAPDKYKNIQKVDVSGSQVIITFKKAGEEGEKKEK
ncbi:MAG: phBC6A51 family helix-turn-helix protein [Elusimicrobiota bacterium]|nr:phBC6A51 family helix-turn-helix protein [Elusimicrobiota bacterium]